jgi:hypothetical protein
MKTIILVLTIVVLTMALVGPPALAQVSCSQYTWPTPNFVYDITADPLAKQHINGNHTYNGAITENCTYQDPILNTYLYCASTASALPVASLPDQGLLSTFPLGFHEGFVATANGSQTNGDGGTQASGTGAGAVEWCLLSNCSFSISANPIVFPSGAVWTHSQTAGPVCPAQPNPNYVPPKCTGCGSCQGCRPPGCSSPVVIDLFDEGIHFTSLNNGVQFDLNGDGKPLYLSWTDPKYHNAWLALDRNHNGTIDSVQELFGYLTEPQVPSRDGKRNGWLALAVYDESANGGNGDGVIDAKDAIYPELLLWIDSNHDGISQPNEVHHLAEMGVTRIPLAYTHKSYKDDNGNNFRFENFVGMEHPDSEHILDRHQAWDVTLDASEDSPGNSPGPLVLCAPDKK